MPHLEESIMKRYRLKKKYIKLLFILGILLILILIIIIVIPKNNNQDYSLEYEIGDYSISENFDTNIYTYKIEYNNVTYPFTVEHTYIDSKKLIKNISSITKEFYECILIESDNFDINPQCSYKNELIDYHLISDDLKKEIPEHFKNAESKGKKVDNYTIYNQDSDKIIWAYKGINILTDDKINYVNIFSKDIYNIDLAVKINDYFVIPDYEQEYEFDKIYLYNISKNKLTTWKLKNKISFESYILGTKDKSIYLVDKKNKKEYEIVPHKKKMRVIGTKSKGGIIYNNNEKEKINMQKLITSEQRFNSTTNYNYIIQNKNLYLKYKNDDELIKISHQKIDSIINIKNDEVYYISKDTLYKYNLKDGEKKVIQYYEWTYNSNNMIFINN